MKELTKKTIAAIVEGIRSYVDEKATSIIERVAVLESREVVDGKDGADGRDGVDGKDGQNGNDGLNGRDGRSAYDLAVEAGFEGSQEDYLTSLRGTPGEPGIDGRDGVDGTPGASIYDLARAAGFEGTEADFLSSQRGEAGKDGRDGRDGRDGKDAENGRDALDVHVLPSIDETRSYPKGTWASHVGGLWVARRATEGMDGWDLIVCGHQDFQIDFDGDRSFVARSILSDGRLVEKTATFPVMIDRGVYKQGMKADQGDVVTFGGSLWVAQRATEDKPGTEGGGWRLAVKKGRDGKDGQAGKDGARGRDGKNWGET